ncbi:NAD(P)-dependent alcohol dehydrogenase [Sphingomonas sp. C3-2]|uniref:zinc-dependent alcohol dehydrogenase family protein n=1 Tax=Sphingomonas sp. C3-2 TaxID=3062169 RepID=UPI00294B08E1|nr:NAD(P)-dependent alcohol dehydrogenase [Sphingomonas sp. C3-2]WOK37497.1 NAD(P)-dependent alcohol dehydrogenase [Sphingomonas sp. C3-2]
MKAYQIGTQKGLDSLSITERPDPIPGPGEVVVKVGSVCLNHRDMLIVSGQYGPARSEERVPCSDGVGAVAAVGEGVTGLAPGDRVSCGHFTSWIDGAFTPAIFGADLGVSRDGWLSEKIVVPAAALTRLSDTITDDQAATLAAAGLTAWHSVVEFGQVKAGDLVLALGTGGVSIFALQFAKMMGARVAITSSSDEKLAEARAMGADITINYRTTPDWAAELLQQTGQRGADIIIETGGQATLGQSIAAAAVNGRIVIIGALAGAGDKAIPNFPTILGKNLVLRGITAGSQAMYRRMLRAVEANGLTPCIDRRFAFDDAPAAYAYLQTGGHLGKVMIEVSQN